MTVVSKKQAARKSQSPVYKQSTGRRLSRCITNNPADGSYYIENLTEQLSEKALQIFKDIW